MAQRCILPGIELPKPFQVICSPSVAAILSTRQCFGDRPSKECIPTNISDEQLFEQLFEQLGREFFIGEVTDYTFSSRPDVAIKAGLSFRKMASPTERC
ncbi:MAG: hypothetical protein IPJ74_05055 [Saprospiraceae bacterium]|nr:hypothetical protein [Saprospiraceae bacterium]